VCAGLDFLQSINYSPSLRSLSEEEIPDIFLRDMVRDVHLAFALQRSLARLDPPAVGGVRRDDAEHRLS
jgi:hypothetical protein